MDTLRIVSVVGGTLLGCLLIVTTGLFTKIKRMEEKVGRGFYKNSAYHFYGKYTTHHDKIEAIEDGTNSALIRIYNYLGVEIKDQETPILVKATKKKK